MQDYVCSAVQIESELVGRELVAGHPVGLESVLEFGDHLLHASSVTIAFRVYEAGPLPLEVRHDISDVCSETVDFDFDNNPLLMLPGIGLVHKRMEHAHLFTGGLVRCNRSVKPVCGYKQLGGDSKYDKLLSDLCRTMNRRILNSDCMNLPTYPRESIYIPDMLVAIVALNKYADLSNGKYRCTVRKWISRATEEWLDEKTGLLVSFLQEDGTQYGDVPVKGSYSALNCYYLTFIDPRFAKEQYETLKSLFWKDGKIAGLKEYHDRRCYLGVDIDAGPILFELSPSWTAFMTGAATYFHDSSIRKDILRTAEIAGHSVRHNGKQHYLLANVALVGESIMLAMRTHFK